MKPLRTMALNGITDLETNEWINNPNELKELVEYWFDKDNLPVPTEDQAILNEMQTRIGGFLLTWSYTHPDDLIGRGYQP